jgi:hypothetical protein
VNPPKDSREFSVKRAVSMRRLIRCAFFASHEEEQISIRLLWPQLPLLSSLGELRAEKIVHVPAGHQIFVLHRLLGLSVRGGGCFAGKVVFRQALTQQFEGLLG